MENKINNIVMFTTIYYMHLNDYGNTLWESHLKEQHKFEIIYFKLFKA